MKAAIPALASSFRAPHNGQLSEARRALARAPGDWHGWRIKRSTASWGVACYRGHTWNGHAKLRGIGCESHRTRAGLVRDEKRDHSPEGAARIVPIIRAAIQNSVRGVASSVETDPAGTY